MDSSIERELNASQRAVVEAIDGPLLVVAGPGAGKTTVLSGRIQFLLEAAASPFQRVLAITFTNVAAAALRQKLERLDPSHVKRVDIGTFHSFAMRLLQQHGTHLGLRADFEIVSETPDREEILSLALAQIGLSSSAGTTILPLLSRLYERCPDASHVAEYLQSGESHEQIGAIFDAYADESIAQGQLDFPLLVFLANRLMMKYPSIARQTRKIYHDICVDEFQDTNDAQFRMLTLIAGSSTNGLLFLADQDQVIYQWNGASVKRLSEAQLRFGMKTSVLPTSFRCPDEIITAANKLISNNDTRFIQPSFDSAVDRHGAIRVVTHATEALETEWLAQTLSELSRDEVTETVVLARGRKLLQAALSVAKARGVRAEMPALRFEFVSAPIVMLHSLLRLASRSENPRRVRQLCTAFETISDISIDAETLIAEAEAQDTAPLSLFLDLVERHGGSMELRTLVTAIRESLVARREYRHISELFFAWIESGDPAIKSASLSNYAEEKDVWCALSTQSAGLESERIPLEEYLRRLDLESKAPVPAGCVKFLTVHAAKGLEFRRVFVIGAAEDQFPSFQAIKAGAGSDLMQEERRSFFVAITRCMELLTLSTSLRYNGYAKLPSRFLREMGLTVPSAPL